MRKTFTTLLVLFLAVFCFGSIGEAAQKHHVRHRPRHSARVTTTPSAAKKKATKARRQAHRTTNAAKKNKTSTKPK
jgi:hypothetical protein